MSDRLENGVLAAPSTGQVQDGQTQENQSGANEQTSQDGQSKAFENIQALQKVLDRKVQEAEKRAQQANAYAQQMQQRLQEMEDRTAPDDFTREQLARQRAEQKAAQYEAMLREKFAEEAEANKRDNTLADIAIRYGVDKKAIEKATNYDEALELAIEARNAKKNQKQLQDDDKRDRNMPDLGSGVPRTASTQWEAQYREAQLHKNTPEMMRLLNEKKGK